MPCIARRSEPLLLRGSLRTFRRRCGKPSCHCVEGQAHESPALVYTYQGQTKTMTLRAEEVAEVEAALARYESRRGELDGAADAGIAMLLARRDARRSTQR